MTTVHNYWVFYENLLQAVPSLWYSVHLYNYECKW